MSSPRQLRKTWQRLGRQLAEGIEEAFFSEDFAADRASILRARSDKGFFMRLEAATSRALKVSHEAKLASWRRGR